MNIILSIDPGLAGGAALLQEDSGQLLKLFNFHKRRLDDKGGKSLPPIFLGETKLEILSYIAQLSEFLEGGRAAISKFVMEAVHSMPGQGVASTFKFGYVTGQLAALADLLDIPVRSYVPPQSWKKHFNLIG